MQSLAIICIEICQPIPLYALLYETSLYGQNKNYESLFKAV